MLTNNDIYPYYDYPYVKRTWDQPWIVPKEYIPKRRVIETFDEEGRLIERITEYPGICDETIPGLSNSDQ